MLMLPNLEKVEDSIQFDHTKVSIFYEHICSCSSMDRTLVSGTEDLGSTPSGSAIKFLGSYLGSCLI